jgi:hypothetical protein
MGRAEARGRILDWTEAGLWIILLVVGSLVALAVMRDSESRNRPRAAVKPAPGGLIEAEDLPVIAKSRDFSFWLQPSSGFPAGKWSKDGHMFAGGTKQGDWIELRLPEREPGRYALEVFFTKAADYGIVAVYVNETPLGEFDLWSAREIVPTGVLKLGDVQLGGRKNALRLEVVGKNPNSSPPFYQFAIDGIRIARPSPATRRGAVNPAVPKAAEAEPLASELDAERASDDGE